MIFAYLYIRGMSLMINVEMFYGRQTTAISCREDEEKLNELPSLEKRPAVKIDKKFLFC